MKRRKRMYRQASIDERSGFTIIEVLIVLAIAGLILLVILFAVPSLRRNARNVERRRVVDLIAAQLHQYDADNGHFPGTAAEGATFVSSYLSDLPHIFTVQFNDGSGPHDYFPPLDTFMVQYEHWCNRYGDGDQPSDPIAGNDTNPHNFVVWTEQEPDSSSAHHTICVDNHT